jgi:hypothetical protein
VIVTEGALQWPFRQQCDPTALQATAAQVADATALALDWLWSLTARRFGTRSVVDRPASLPAGGAACGMYPSYLQSVYGPLGWGGLGGWTGLPPEVIELQGPAVAVTQVSITDSDGLTAVLATNAYRLEGNYLIRQDGGVWPLGQNMVAALGQANTWAVTYNRGYQVPLAGQVAMGLLICEFLKALRMDKSCRLPANVTAATRSGVSVTLDLTKAMRTTGVAEVDRWVTSVNPNGRQGPGQVWSPDVRRNQPPYRGVYARGF